MSRNMHFNDHKQIKPCSHMEHFANFDQSQYTDTVIPVYLEIIQNHIQKKSNYLEEFGDLYPFIIHINRVKDFRMTYANEQIQHQLQVSTDDALRYNLSLWRELYKLDSFRFVQKYTRKNIPNLTKGKIIKYIQILKPQQSKQFVDMLTYRKMLDDRSFLSISITQNFVRKCSKLISQESLMVTNEDHDLSRRELEILKLVSSGMTSHETARYLFISRHTVDTHRRNIIRKLGANNLLEAYQILQSNRILQ